MQLSLQKFQQRLAGKDLGDCQAEWFEHKVFEKASYSQQMAFLGLVFQDHEIKLTIEQMAQDGLISVGKQIRLSDLEKEMKLSFEPVRAGTAWNGIIVGKLTGFREAQIMLSKISQLLMECQQKELHVLNWTGFQLCKDEWLRTFQRHNIKIHVYLALEFMSKPKSVFKTKFDYNEQVKGTVSEDKEISLNVMCDDKEILVQMSLSVSNGLF